MTVSRRSLLLGGLSVPLLALANRTLSFAASSPPLPNPLMVVVSGADGDTTPARLAKLADPFLFHGVPLALTISPFDGQGRPLEQDSEMAVWLRQSLRRNSDGLEIGIHAETVSSPDPYFQLRQVSEAQAAFCKAINAYEHYRSNAVVMAETLSTRSPLRSWQDGAPMRPAGIRSVVRLPGSQPDAAGLQPADGGYWMTGTGLVNIFGSHQTSIHPAERPGAPRGTPTLLESIERLAKGNEPVIVDVSFDGLGRLSEAELASYGSELAQTVLQVNASGKARCILPKHLYRQSRQKRRFVVVRVDDLRISPGTDVTQMAFTQRLIEAGYPVSEAVVPAPLHGLFSRDDVSKDYVKSMFAKGRYDVSTHGWNHTPSELRGRSASQAFTLIRDGVSEVYRSTGRFPVSYVPPNNAFDQNTLEALARTGTPLISAEKGDYSWFCGMDKRGVMHVSNTVMFEKQWNGEFPYFETGQVLDFIGEDNDAVFSIHPLTANTRRKEQQILDTLEILSRQSGTALVSFDEYYEAIMPAMPHVERIQRARADVVIRDSRAVDDSRAETALMQDGALAWRYFEWGARNFDGMVPATVWTENGTRQGYAFTTMWDVASYILAAISAHRIGLIDERQFETTVVRIVAFLGTSSFPYKGAMLPATERALKAKGAQRDGFDSADSGRLLIALKILDKYAGGGFAIAKLVADWGFEAALADGEMHVIKGGRATSVHANSYAGYVARGYELWGHALKPIFETTRPDTDMDEAVKALGEMQRRGRIATEPHVTEEIELGGSPHGRQMADILYSAQMKRYRETGILTCASEGPTTGAPYFTYQGYQIEEDGGGQFVVDAPTKGTVSRTARRERELRAISTKGAYLWYATRPGDYSDRLIELAREQAKMPDIGFASGISEMTGKRFEIADVNTNGIILEAIAFMLGDRKPFLLTSAGLGDVERT